MTTTHDQSRRPPHVRIGHGSTLDQAAHATSSINRHACTLGTVPAATTMAHSNIPTETRGQPRTLGTVSGWNTIPALTLGTVPPLTSVATLDQSKPAPHMHIGHGHQLDQPLHCPGTVQPHTCTLGTATAATTAHTRTFAPASTRVRWARSLVRTVGAA